MKFRDVLVGLLKLLVAAVALNLFLPIWLVRILVGLVAVVFIYDWLIRSLGLNSVVAGKIGRLTTAVFVVHLALLGINVRWPWLGQALEARQYYTSLWFTDRANPKYPQTLALALYNTEGARLNSEEAFYVKALEKIQDKIRRGDKPDSSDLAVIEGARQYLPELTKQLEGMNLGRPKSKRVSGSSKTFGSATVIERTAPLDGWSKVVEIPVSHRFRVVPEGRILVRTWRGDEFERQPGDGGGPWLGRLSQASFWFKSLEAEPVKVLVELEPM